MADSAGTVDTEERWADYKTAYPKGYRVFRLATIVWAIGGIPGIVVVVGIGYGFSSQPGAPIQLGLAGWAVSWIFLLPMLNIWHKRIDRWEHLHLLRLQDTRQVTAVVGPEFSARGTLLDPNRNNYVVKRSSLWAGNIYDENGRTIGRGVWSHGQGGQMHSLHEVDGTRILLIQPGAPDPKRHPKNTYVIGDRDGHLLGRVKWRKGRGLSGRDPPFVMVLVSPSVQESEVARGLKDAQFKKLFESMHVSVATPVEEETEDREEHEVLIALEEPGSRFLFVINEDESGRRIAEFGSFDAPPEVIERRKMWRLHVLDPSYDRRSLMGLAIVYLDRLEDYRRAQST